ncbi:MAG: peptidylprolyl isomerase [Acidobacteriota bacterium]
MKKNLLFAVLFGVSINISAQVEDQVVAKVGNATVSASEIKERFALTPWPKSEKGKLSKDPKSEFLYTIIAEKLLAQKARDLGYDTSAVMNSTFKTIEKMYVRDALYKHEISSRVNITNAELDKAVQKNRYKLKLDCLKAQDEKGAQALYNSLKKGVPFNSLLEKNSALAKDSLLEVSFGEVDSSLEETLFNLKPGMYTDPVHSLDGWLIFRLAKRIDRYSTSAKEREKVVGEARKILDNRANDVIYQRYYKSFFAGRKVNVDGYMFWSFADKVIKILTEKRQDSKVPDKEKPFVSIPDFMRIEKEFGPDSLKMTFISLDSNPVSLKKFLDEVAFDGFVSSSVEPGVLRAKLDHRVKYYIENELLAEEGFRKGLQNLPEVKQSIQMWRDSFLSQVLKSQIMDSVKANPGDLESVRKQLEAKDEVSVPMVNIAEVLTDSLETVEKILDGLNNHIDIHELARRYTKREWTREKSGEFGFFPTSMYGEIGRIAGEMKVGDVYGPLKTEDGYSIFKLIGKKTDKVGLKDNKAGKSSSMTSKDLINEEYLQKLTRYTATLAKSYGVSVNEDALNSADALNMNIFAYRYMGFGGRLMAVPLTVPFSNWVEAWKKQLNMP